MYFSPKEESFIKARWFKVPYRTDEDDPIGVCYFIRSKKSYKFKVQQQLRCYNFFSPNEVYLKLKDGTIVDMFWNPDGAGPDKQFHVTKDCDIDRIIDSQEFDYKMEKLLNE